MIAQSLSQSQYGVNNVKSLATYVLRLGPAQSHEDPSRWGLKTEHSNEAVAWAKAVNCASDNLGWAVKDMDLTQQMNKMASTSKSYHYVVSFPEGEKPSRAVLENIEAVLSTAIGYREHQRLMAVHRDTAHLHMHVVVNRVHPDTFLCRGSAFDYLTLARTTAELETVHNLTPTNHAPGTRDLGRDRPPPFQPSWQVTPPTPLSPELVEQFRIQKQQAYQARQAAFARLRQQHQDHLQKLTAYHRLRRRNAALQPLSRANRISTGLFLQETFKTDHEKRKAREAKEREALRQQFPLLTMDAFKATLVEAAAKTPTLDREVPERSHLHFPDRTKRGPVPARQRD